MDFICNNCGCTFDEDLAGAYWDQLGEGRWDGEYVMCCPSCNSNDFSNAIECKRCGHWTSEENAIEGLCEECQQKLIDITNTFWKGFTEAEKVFIYENFDWDS